MLNVSPAVQPAAADETPETAAPLPFIDLKAQRRRLGTALDRAIARVLDHGQFILGPEVDALEADLTRFCGARHAISCANGTDALALVLMAKGVGPGDAVICPSFTFAATAEVVAWVGATAVFADVKAETFNLDAASVRKAVDLARKQGLRPVAIIPVDLFGLPADYDAIEAIARDEGLWILSDAAQSFGAVHRGRRIGTIGLATATSFFPAKPLGCYGDGGAIFTDDDELPEILRSLRVHGQGRDRYDNVRIGLNARMDALQAAILAEKLRVFPDEILSRDAAARRYSEALRDIAIVPEVPAGLSSVWAQYTLRLPGVDRDAFQAALKAEGVPTMVYYPRPLHRQPAYARFPAVGGSLPVTEKLAGEVVSLPMHGYLDQRSQDRVISAVRRALGRG
jgi:dTDP-4-amino-4,6-dideoxygalactose transaminase